MRRFDPGKALRSDGSAHQHAGTELGAAKSGYGLEPLLLEHGHGAVCGLISEGVRFAASDGIGLQRGPLLCFLRLPEAPSTQRLLPRVYDTSYQQPESVLPGKRIRTVPTNETGRPRKGCESPASLLASSVLCAVSGNSITRRETFAAVALRFYFEGFSTAVFRSSLAMIR
jgi:hypothetical protein